MAESDPIDPKVKKSFSRVIAGVHETLCEKLDLKRVGEQLTTGTRLKKTLRGLVRRAVKDKDVEFFFSILSQKFNLKSLVFFLEVLDSTAAENHDHKEILTILCHNLEELPVEDEPSEVVKQLKKITSRYVSISAMVEELSVEDESSGVVTILENMPGISADAPIVVLYHEYEVETFSFSKSKSHVQHSSTHDVTVYVEPVAFPEDLDRFNVSLTVNNYAQPITMPPQFTAVYSVLINLKCEPPFEKFEDYVTVTLPHCAVGDIDSLCVLSAPDGDYNLVEDLDIEIVSIDEAYVTFRTRHFSNNTVSASKRRKQKILKLKQRAAFLRAASLDETARRMSHKARPIRSYSSPAVFENEPDMQFCVLMCRPCDTSSASHWQFVFIVITDEITLTEEARTHAATSLNIDCVTKLTFAEARFTFKLKGIEFSPSSSSKNGWTITPDHTPAEIMKKQVEQYWHLTRKQRRSAKPPYIIYTATKEGVPHYTSFSITLNGSQSLLRKEDPIAFNVPCHLEPNPPLPQPKTVRIISEMYSEKSAIIEGLSGRLDCSKVRLNIEDSDTCTLLCEISFHLHLWKNLGQHLGMTAEEVEVVICTYENSTYFREPAYQLLKKWLESDWVKSKEMPTLQKMVDSLLCIDLQLQLSTWNTLYSEITRRMENLDTPQLAYHIQRHWRSLSRLLGFEATIDTVVQHEGSTLVGQACYMIEQWKKRIIDDGPLRYTGQLRTMDVFNALHCVHEHLYDNSLKNAILLFM